jgi:hypothetical protein
MKKIYQTIIDPDHGNCMQAAIASLFNKNLEEVPNFIELDDNWFSVMCEFIESQGYTVEGTVYNNAEVYDLKEEVNRYTGVNGLFYAGVHSPKYHKQGGTHAVLVDRELNIVFDPNPGYATIDSYPYADEMGYNGVIDVLLINKIEPSQI